MQKKINLVYLLLAVAFVQSARAEIVIAPGQSIYHQGEQISCRENGSGGDSGGIITPTRCNDRWIYITVKFPSGKEIAPGALDTQVRSRADCELIANAFRKYEGSFSGSKTIRFCSQYPRSVTANLFECLISPESNNMVCTEMAKLPDMATCAGRM